MNSPAPNDRSDRRGLTVLRASAALLLCVVGLSVGGCEPNLVDPSSIVHIQTGPPADPIPLADVLRGFGLPADAGFMAWLQENGYAAVLTKDFYYTNPILTAGDVQARAQLARSYYAQYLLQSAAR